MAGNDQYTKLLLHCDGINNGVVFPDSSFAAPAHTVTPIDNVHTDTGVKKFGTASMQCDGAGDYVEVDDHADWTFGADDFTIDFWYRPTSIVDDTGFCGQHVDIDNYWSLDWSNLPDNEPRLILRSGAPGPSLINDTFTAWAFTVGVWTHVALVRDGGTYRLFMNGNAFGTIVPGGNPAWPDFGATLDVGLTIQSGRDAEGYIDEFRVSKGIARWTSAFTPPTSAYTMPLPGVNFNTTLFRGRHDRRKLISVAEPHPTVIARVPTWAGNDANVTASKLKVDSYNITWDAVRYTTYGGIEVEYEVSLNKDGAGYVTQAILPDSATDFNVCDLASGVYVARVRARYHKLTTIWYEAGYWSIDTFDLTAAFTWPATLPQTVSQPRYTEGMVSIVERSEMDSGPAKVRRRHTAGVERFSSTMQLTTAQVVTLEEFFEVSVQGGALEFAWTHPRTGVAVKMRFVNPPVITQIGPAHWNASLALEILP